jgi:protein-L-isoaspartate O-methyltransferase
MYTEPAMRVLLVASMCVLPAFAQDRGAEMLAPYTPTPAKVVDRMLELAGLREGEKVVDVGSGDGRIVIRAASKYKADATGVELDGALVKRSQERIRRMGLASTAHVIQGDLLKQDYSSADLITVYLLPVGNEKLTPILEKQLKKGARVVSNNSPFQNWTPAKVEEIGDDGVGHSARLYLYIR